MIDRPGTIVQEDKAPAHDSPHQRQVFMDWGILRMIWPGNSPDLNMIEPCWVWMKRKTTQKGPPKTRKEAVTAWTHCWNNQLKQKKIQEWIERIPRAIQEIIRCGGGNEYREGREGGDVRSYDAEDRRRRYEQEKAQEWEDIA